MRPLVFLALLLAPLALHALHAEEKPPPDPQVTAVVPLAVPQGFTGTIRLRGIRMKDATEIRTGAPTIPDKLEIKEKKDAGNPSGMSGDKLGDSEVLVNLAIPADFPTTPLPLTVTTGDKSAKPAALQILPPDQLTVETEPNNGFTTATKIPPTGSVTGLINTQRDVDVFELPAKAGVALKITVATHDTSLLDPLLTAYDAHGTQLATHDDTAAGSPDATLAFTPTTDGPVFLTLQDALDYGSEWHAYHLEISEEKRVSFADDVWPILRANCVSCHRPAKLKGKLDLTSFAAITRGGKNGPVLTGHVLLDAVSGEEPDMPSEGEPLLPEEIDLLATWIAQGAIDDTPPTGLGTRRPAQPPVYTSLPAIPAIAFSPDGTLLAVAAHHEIIVHRADGSEIIGRWPGDSRRIESLQFSRDGKFLAAAGGAPSEFGEIQIWETATAQLVRSIRAGADTLYGVSWSDDGARLAVGGADKLVRAFDTTTGTETMRCDNHLDWVFATAFVHDGSKLVSVSRDRAVKLIDVSTGHLIDDAAQPREPVLALARHPHEDIVAYTGEEGKVRLHRMAPRGGRLKEGDNKEESAIREFEHMATTLHAVAFSPDGTHLATAGDSGEVRIFQTDNGQRKTTIPNANGPIFALAYHPTNNYLATAGTDGQIRLYNPVDGKLVTTSNAVPLAFP